MPRLLLPRLPGCCQARLLLQIGCGVGCGVGSALRQLCVAWRLLTAAENEDHCVAMLLCVSHGWLASRAERTVTHLVQLTQAHVARQLACGLAAMARSRRSLGALQGVALAGVQHACTLARLLAAGLAAVARARQRHRRSPEAWRSRERSRCSRTTLARERASAPTRSRASGSCPHPSRSRRAQVAWCSRARSRARATRAARVAPFPRRALPVAVLGVCVCVWAWVLKKAQAHFTASEASEASSLAMADESGVADLQRACRRALL